MLTEDRKRTGVLLNLPIRDNITISTIKKVSNKFGWINSKKENQIVDDLVKKLQIKLASVQNNVSSLSGGNQQKVALAKWLGSGCKVLILDEPTRGVDVGAKVEIYKIINQLAEEGAAIIMISSEMAEVMQVSDRILVMHEGSISGELTAEEVTRNNIMQAAFGGVRE